MRIMYATSVAEPGWLILMTCLQSTQQLAQDPKCYYDTGKVTVLLRLVDRYMKEGRKMLLFSQVRRTRCVLARAPS
jgi:SWI/SNF-related matrix-associated actin-dependent regulator 1 of chromatin subfamily A